MTQFADRNAVDGVKSAARCLAILELLTAERRPLSFAQLESMLDFPRSSLHGLLKTLKGRGWIEFEPATRRFALGIRTWEAGSAYLQHAGMAERALPLLEHVRDATDETVLFSVLDGRHVVYLEKAEGSQALKLACEVGRRLVAHATASGKVLLAGLSPAQLDRALESVELEFFTPNTLADRQDLEAALERIRRQGYAIDREEYTPGVFSIAAPIRNHSGDVVAAMGMSVPAVRFSAKRQTAVLAVLTEAAARLSAAQGFRPVVRSNGAETRTRRARNGGVAGASR